MEALNQQLIRAGFAQISIVEISDKDLPYHVEASDASVTTAVYHHREFDTGATFRYQTISVENILKKHYRPGKTVWDDWKMEDVPGYNADIPTAGWRNFGVCNSHYKDSRHNSYRLIDFRLEPEDTRHATPASALVSLAETVAETVKPICNRLFIQSFRAERFAPTYQFKDCDKLFAERFDIPYFRKVVPAKKGAAQTW